MQHDGGGTCKRRRFTEGEFSRGATSPSYASYLETLMQDSAPQPAVGTWPQPRRKRFDEESALARDSRQHDKPYGYSFHELDRLQEPKKYHNIDNSQVVDKYQDSYHGTGSYHNHGHNGPERLSGCSHAYCPPDGFAYRPCISVTKEVSHDQSCYDSDYDRAGKRDDSWKRRDSRKRDKKSLSRERDQSYHDRGSKRDDSWKRHDSRDLSRERDQSDYDRGGRRDDSWKRRDSREREKSLSQERDQSDYDRAGKRDDSWKRRDSRKRDKKSLSREIDQSDYDRGGKRDDSWKRHDSRERDKKSLSREIDQSDYDRGGKRDDSWKRRDSCEREKSLSRERDQSDYDRGGKRDDSWKRRDSRERDKKSLSRERDRSPRRRCQHSCSRGNDDRQRSKSSGGYSHRRSYLEDSYDVGRHGSSGKLMNRDDGRSQDHSKVVPSVTVVVKGLPGKTTEKDLYQILEAWGPFCRIRVINQPNSVSSSGFVDFPSMVTARKMMDGIGDAGLVVDGRTLLFQFRIRKKESKSKHEKENRRKKRIKKAIERAVQHQQDGEGGEKIHQNQKKLPQQQKQPPQQLLEVDEIQTEPSSHGISSSILDRRITCIKELQQQQLLEVDEVQHKPSSHDISSSILEERMTCIKEDQYPQAIMEANETGDPAIEMRFLNDPEVLQKLGDGMGFGASVDVINPTEYRLYSAPYDNAEDKSAKEGMSIVSRTGGVGDTEKEMDRLPKEERVTEKRKMSKSSRSHRRKKLKKAYERRTALAAQLRANNALYTGHGREECVAEVTSGNIAAVPIVEELEVDEIQPESSSHGISSSILDKRITCIKELQQQQKQTQQQLLEVDEVPHKPSSHDISSSILEERITCIKEDQYPKAIMEANETGDPAVVMRFLNDPEVLQKLGGGMGFGASVDAINPTEYRLHSAPYDNAEDKSAKEGTSIVGRTGGVGDTEKEMDRLPKEKRVTQKRKMSKNSRSHRRKKLKKAYERMTARAAQLRANNALYTGHGREECVAAVTSGNIAAIPIVEELEIGNLQHDFSADPISTSISEEDLEELMSCIKKDPYLKPIVDDIEIGGPTVMMWYLNDSEVLQKLGKAMGFGLSGEIVDTTKHNAPADYAKSKIA
ncbi:hypothetical protein MKX03_031509 [Papaver bracteatum]|nr:hypothetical protein MKX03_031509 [Papaver bracteatum]